MSEARDFEVRLANATDRPFLVEMAREACALEGRHALPPADDPAVVALLPDSDHAAVVADRQGRLLGAAWWLIREAPLVSDEDGEPLPEMAMAVVREDRGTGIGSALVEELAARASARFPALTLNVHLLNHAAVRLYVRTGFHVAGAGRGPFGVGMIRALPRSSDAGG
jgi:GNAT superfamily N-acetyltransferase